MKKHYLIPVLSLLMATSAMAQTAQTDAQKAGNAFSQAGDNIANGFTNGYKATEKATVKTYHEVAKGTVHVAKKTGEYADNAGTKTARFFTEKPKTESNGH